MIVSVGKYLTKVLNEWTEVLRNTRLNTHTDNIFMILDDDDNDCELLPEESIHSSIEPQINYCSYT